MSCFNDVAKILFLFILTTIKVYELKAQKATRFFISLDIFYSKYNTLYRDDKILPNKFTPVEWFDEQ